MVFGAPITSLVSITTKSCLKDVSVKANILEFKDENPHVLAVIDHMIPMSKKHRKS